MRFFGIRRKDADRTNDHSGWLTFTNGEIFCSASFAVALAQFWSMASGGYDPVEHWQVEEFNDEPFVTGVRDRPAAAGRERRHEKLRFTAREVQQKLSIGNTKFWRLVSDGRLRVHRDGPRVYVTSEELDRYLDSLR